MTQGGAQTMNITVTQEQGRVPVTIFHVEGRVNMGSAQELEEKARSAYADGMRDLLIDLSGVLSMTSAGLRAIHVIFKLLEDKPVAGGVEHKSMHLKLSNPPAEIRRVFQISGFDRFIDIHDDLQAALASF
jgi:anti-anti-sigma factor